MASTSIIPDCLTRLRGETSALHARLEGTLDWQGICGDRAQYSRLVARFYGVQMRWELDAAPHFAAPAEHDLFWSRRKTDLLKEDLRFLGWSEQAIEDTRKLPARSLDLHTRPGALGVMYVLEGSTLGGPSIARMVERGLGFRDGCGYSYFRSYGPQLRNMWLEFGQFLNSAITNEQQQEAAVASAKRTFQTMEQWLSSAEQ